MIRSFHLKRQLSPSKSSKNSAFSLVEMLMALLVASLLLAALAPVMTKKVKEPDINIITEAANYNKESIITIFTDSSETKEFNIPLDTSRINITMMGGGGAGGDALYGNKEFTTSQTFTVPKDVKKLRVFMIGGGGGGASGGMGNGLAYGSTPAIGSTYTTVTTAGSYTFADIDTPSNHLAPSTLPVYCQKYGTTKKWVVASDTATVVNPGAKIPKIDRMAMVNLSKFTGCGAGGGAGGNGGAGGSGGYLADKALATSVTASNLSLKIGSGGLHCGGGGAGGGTGGAQGGCKGAGGNGINGKGGDGVGCGGGGGGGTAISVISSGAMIAQIGGGGGGGAHCVISTAYVSTGTFCGGGGGGYGAGGGGGGCHIATRSTDWSCVAAYSIAGSSTGEPGGITSDGRDPLYYPGQMGGAGYGGGGGGGGGCYSDNVYGETAPACSKVVAGTENNGTGGGAGGCRLVTYPSTGYTYGGGGGGGAGGIGGAGGLGGDLYGGGGKLTSSIFNNSTNCSGGNHHYATEKDGKPGAARIWYSVNAVPNGLQCAYSTHSNGGGGGGAGQIWMGEIDVTPGQTITLNIGQGGAVQNIGAENGNNGTATSITVGGNTYSVSGGEGGKFKNDDTYIASSGGLGGGIKTANFNSSAVYKDWLKLNDKGVTLTGGNRGEQGYLKTDSKNSAGGNGGSALKMDGTYATGGVGGSAAASGSNSTNYGTGGGGGGAGTTGTSGNGGSGANGYIYIEWGGTNGGGGTAGEIIQGVLTNFDGADRKMLINIGKGGNSSTGNGNGETTALTVKSGGKNVTLSARGGIKGNIGTSDVNTHGADMVFPTGYNTLYTKFIQGNMSIINGQKGIKEYGGMGGYLSCIFNAKDNEGRSICLPSISANDGVEITAGPTRPGCGGSTIPSPLYDAICLARSTAANPSGGDGKFGGGGGGGAVLNNTGGKGGNGGDGFVILEYKSVQ